MNSRTRVARWLIGLGSLVLFAGALLHLIAAYPQVSAGVAASNLAAALQPALRTVFLLADCHWIAFALIATIAAYARAQIGKAVVLICGFALLVDTAIMVRFLHWFIGSEMIVPAALLILCGGFMLAPARSAVETLVE